MNDFKAFIKMACLTVSMIVFGIVNFQSLHFHQHDHGVHPCEVDVPFGVFSPKEIAEMESIEPDSSLSSKTRPILAAGVVDKTLTFVIDFKEPNQPVTSDIFGNAVGSFDFVDFGFSEDQFELFTGAILNEVFDDFFDELKGTVANQDGEQLRVNFIVGDIGVAPKNVTEFYFIQVGSALGGIGSLGVAGGGVVRSALGEGPNFGIQIGDVVGSVYTNNIQNLGGLSPANALSSGNLEFSVNSIAGTLSHEIGHTLSLSHINVSKSVQPSPDSAPIMATGAIDLPNQTRISDREFSLLGFDGQSGNASRFHIDQLACAAGPLSDIKDKLTFYYTGPEGGDFFDENNWNKEPDGTGSVVPSALIEPGFVSDIGIDLVIDGASVIAANDVDFGLRGSGSLTLLNGARLDITGIDNDLDFDSDASFTLVDSIVAVDDNIFFGGDINLSGGAVISGDDIDFTSSATLTIAGTSLTAFDDYDFLASFSSIKSATFSNSGQNGEFRIDGFDATVVVRDSSIIIGLESSGFGDFESNTSTSSAGTLELRGTSDFTVDQVREGADLRVFDNSEVFVNSNMSGVGNGGSTITLFSTSSSLCFLASSLDPVLDRRDFVIDGVTGLTYNEAPSAWNISEWNGLDAVELQITNLDILLGDVNLDEVVNLLDVSPFVALLSNQNFQAEADINQDGLVNLLDIPGFVELLSEMP